MGPKGPAVMAVALSVLVSFCVFLSINDADACKVDAVQECSGPLPIDTCENHCGSKHHCRVTIFIVGETYPVNRCEDAASGTLTCVNTPQEQHCYDIYDCERSSGSCPPGAQGSGAQCHYAGASFPVYQWGWVTTGGQCP